jgi:CheY-like chemotaxis protein
MPDTGNRILVVDDLPDWRATLGGLLEDEGYRVEAAGSSAEALRLLEGSDFDLVLVDVRLDDTDEKNTEGLDLAGRIGERWPAVKIVAITGYGDREIMERAIRPDVQGRTLVADYVPKERTGELARVVRRVLSRQ